MLAFKNGLNKLNFKENLQIKVQILSSYTFIDLK